MKKIEKGMWNQRRKPHPFLWYRNVTGHMADVLIQCNAVHDRQKFFQEWIKSSLFIENPIRQRADFPDRNIVYFGNREIRFGQNGKAVTGTDQREDHLQVITDINRFRRKMLGNLVLYPGGFGRDGIGMAGNNVL